VAFSVRVNGTRVAIRGELDLAGAPDLDAALQGLTGDITIECYGLEFIDSSGLNVFLKTHNRLRAENRQLHIQGLSATCQRVFEISRLDKTLNLRP
jgi:anti-anti-sigma factor